MKETIKKAIEGGFNIFEWHDTIRLDNFRKIDQHTRAWGECDKDGSACAYSLGEIWSDKNFWQALGKAEGWKIEKKASDMNNTNFKIWWEYEWLVNWHRFIDHLASGGNAEEFFKQLLTQH